MRKLLPPLFGLILLPAVALAGHDKACKADLQACLDKMVAELKSTGFIGVELDDSKHDKLVVTKVISGTPAEKGGIQKGDVLVALNGIPFSKENLKKMAKVKKPGREVTCTIRRDGTNKDIKLTLAPMPADMMAKYIGEHMMQYAKMKEARASNP